MSMHVYIHPSTDELGVTGYDTNGVLYVSYNCSYDKVSNAWCTLY